MESSYPVIAIGLSPNTERDDVSFAFRELITPWNYFSGNATEKVKARLQKTYGSRYVITANSGRSALLMLLQAFGIGRGDEVIVQAFTCVAVPNSVLWAGATPVYADIDETLNLDAEKLEKKITKKTKAIIIQHTFGIPANSTAIIKIVKSRNIIIIEDCAHSFGETVNKKELGTLGDAAFISFGRDKVLSSVFGGAAIISNKHKIAGETLLKLEQNLPNVPRWWVAQQLFHPVAFFGILPIYTSKIGKALVVLLQKIHFLSFPVYLEEKQGLKPSIFPAKYPESLARIILHQLSKLERFQNIRKQAVIKYRNAFPELSDIIGPSDMPLLRVPMLTYNSKEVLEYARLEGIYLGNWYKTPIDPQGVEFDKVKYEKGSCPVAEEKAVRIINLPTLINQEKIQKVIDFMKLMKLSKLC